MHRLDAKVAVLHHRVKNQVLSFEELFTSDFRPYVDKSGKVKWHGTRNAYLSIYAVDKACKTVRLLDTFIEGDPRYEDELDEILEVAA